MKRRQALILFALGLKFSRVAAARPIYGGMSILNAPLELAGPWRGSPVGDATAVVERMRSACLSDVALLSDHQPSRLRVDDHSEGPPAIWLHSEFPTTAWMIVDVGPLDWCNLCYQFGHELGHVVCNSWQPLMQRRVIRANGLRKRWWRRFRYAGWGDWRMRGGKALFFVKYFVCFVPLLLNFFSLSQPDRAVDAPK